MKSVPPEAFADKETKRRDDLKYRLIGFDDQTGQGRLGQHVGYFFSANGEYTEDPLQVRRLLQNLMERYGYYAKVEMMATLGDPDHPQNPEYRAAAEKRDEATSSPPACPDREVPAGLAAREGEEVKKVTGHWSLVTGHWSLVTCK